MLIERLMKFALLGSEWVLYLLLVLSVVSFSTMIERWVYFLRRRGNAEALRKSLTEKLDAADVEGVEALLEKDKSIIARVVREALRWLAGGPEAVADAVDSELGRIRADLERGSNLLGTLGNNAPFIGLFGTVLGVIIAFHALGDSGGNAQAMGGVMAGIAEALVATGVGLFVALPAVVAYNVVQQKIGDIENEAASLVKLISAYAKADPKVIEHAKLLDERRANVARLVPHDQKAGDKSDERQKSDPKASREAKKG